MAFKDFIDRLRSAGEDLATLDVATLSGSVEIKLAGDKIDFDALVKSIQDQVTKVDGTVQIVAFTRIDLDKDAIQFVKSGLSDDDKPLVAAHNEMVKTSQEARLAVVRFIKDVIPG
jgi:hypothetical protein